ncbi:spermidine/putrescine ABC transporter ATP-binding protein [Subtercola boreus]|uniref:ABC-type quaternary amine transporter n=1 Tax=Subtercola boreus TaxID=120213 RepID=A0A3E0VV34_9MICO|nr:ABC transporter ATP-binding protein [Subtercola boreus]RFA13631.1 spermidine/putrescine ABC transporter ATP-binding protein [Subtercola boreus]
MTSLTAPAPRAGLAPTVGASVELIDVVKDYGTGTLALDSLNLHVRPGEFVALLGPSGCGKTTALRSVAGLESVTSGGVAIGGVDVTDQPTNRRDLGMVFQSYSLFPHLDAARNVEFGLQMRKVPAALRRTRALEALEMVGLGGYGDRFAHQLSGGQQQRVALARALVTRPRVLLLDEPLSALDAKVRVQLRDEIRRIQTELGITTLFVTHDQEEALAVADRVAVMRAGTIEQIGTPESLYTQPATTFVAEFVGLSNRLPGVAAGGYALVHGIELPLLDPTVAPGPVTVYVRPEDLEIVPSGTSAVPADPLSGTPALTGPAPVLVGTVVSTSFLGSIRRSTVRLPDGGLIAVQHGVGVRPAPGEHVHLRFGGACVSATPAP